MVNNQSIICISTADWEDFWTRKQRFMLKFAQQNNKVLYIEQQMHFLGYLKHFRLHGKRVYLWLLGSREIFENLFVYTLPILLPFYKKSPVINKINHLFALALIRREAKKLRLKNPILWIYPPESNVLIGKFNEKAVVYDCVDEWSAFKGMLKKRIIQEFEKRLLLNADLVIVTAQPLYESKKKVARNIYLVPNAAEPAHFAKASLEETEVPQEIAQLKKPIIGFVGSIQYWIDFDLIRYIALARPHWTIVLIGPVGRLAKVEKLNDLPNIHLLGKKDYERLPNYLKAFDVCINPFIMDEVGENVSPLKLYEYLATGKPIVSVNMPEAEKFGELVRIGHTKEDFLSQLEEALNESNPDLAFKRMQISHQHSWDKRFDVLNEIIEKFLDA